jgi:hypothetical protein
MDEEREPFLNKEGKHAKEPMMEGEGQLSDVSLTTTQEGGKEALKEGSKSLGKEVVEEGGKEALKQGGKEAAVEAVGFGVTMVAGAVTTLGLSLAIGGLVWAGTWATERFLISDHDDHVSDHPEKPTKVRHVKVHVSGNEVHLDDKPITNFELKHAMFAYGKSPPPPSLIRAAWVHRELLTVGEYDDIPDLGEWELKSAYYGSPGDPSARYDVTARFRRHIDGSGPIGRLEKDRHFGDPCPGVVKVLYVEVY